MLPPTKSRFHWLLFVPFVPFLLILWPPLYNVIEPTLVGIPFFYWFQLFLMLIAVAITAIIYRLA